MVRLEVFFDYSSPWTYLAFSQIESIVQRWKCEVSYRPFLVGGVFNTVNSSVYEARKSTPAIKVEYGVRDLQEWADTYGLKIRGPYDSDPNKRVKPFPVNSVKALRGALFAMQQDKFLQYSNRVFKAYWADSQDISDNQILFQIAKASGLNEEEFHKFIVSDEAKNAIRTNTDELVQRGGFGTPTIFVNNKYMYWGNDRLILVERRIALESGFEGARTGCGRFENTTSKL